MDSGSAFDDRPDVRTPQVLQPGFAAQLAEAVQLNRQLLQELRHIAGRIGDLENAVGGLAIVVRGILADVSTAAAAPAWERPLFAAIVGAFTDKSWVVAELLARSVRGDVAANALATAVCATGKENARALGQLIAKCAGHSHDGWRLTRLPEADDSAGAVYVMVREQS